MKKYAIIVGLFLFCLLLTIPPSEAAKMYASDLTVSRVVLNEDGPEQGAFTITNVGNKNNGQFEVLVYFKKKDGSVFKQFYQSNKSIAPGYSRYYKNVFPSGSHAVAGLVRVNPFKRFQEWDYGNNVRYFAMLNRSPTTFHVQEGIQYYDAFLDEDVYVSLGSGNFPNGGYKPVISTPNPIQIAGEDYYVNRLNVTFSVPLPGILTLTTISGIPYIHYNALFLQVDDGYEGDDIFLLPMSWDATRGILYKYTVSNVRGFVIQLSECDESIGQFIETFSNITVTFRKMQNSWVWNA